MCGIVGIIGRERVADQLLDGLRRLEYRGYDSAGIATLEDGYLILRRAEGKLRNLERRLANERLAGSIGIGHTRWATHGKPNEANAHPHVSDGVAVVHNGIIENFRELRSCLQAEGFVFASDTDSEVVAHLVASEMRNGRSPEDAVAATLPRLRGSFALAFLFEGKDDVLIGVRRGSPLAIGYGDGEMYLSSDAIALAPFTKSISYLEDGDCALLRRQGAQLRNANVLVSRPIQNVGDSSFSVSKGNYRHFMAKELHEQPRVVRRTLEHYLDARRGRVVLPQKLPFDFRKLQRLSIAACGTSYYAGLVAKHWFERFARLPVEVDFASECRYRDTPHDEGNLTILISQSGETADTLAALRQARAQDHHTLSVVNVSTSTMARESDVAMPTLAGPEIGVASTKAFTCQLAALICVAIAAGRARGVLSEADEVNLCRTIGEVPRLMGQALALEPAIERLARGLARSKDLLYLGRGTSYPLALEGALKLKEISYIHAEAYAAGELKHGPLALVDESVPVIAIAPFDRTFHAMVSNMQEVAARGGRIILITHGEGADHAVIKTLATLELPEMTSTLTPFVYAIPIQLIAYHTAAIIGTDIDRPRNLAKSVTVE
jgi:glucosamine--fructose-6-phosphate aminotransferase (isomerizing)